MTSSELKPFVLAGFDKNVRATMMLAPRTGTIGAIGSRSRVLIGYSYPYPRRHHCE